MSVDFQIICTFFRILEHAVYLARNMAVTSDHHGKKMPLAGACCIFETPSSEAKNPFIVDSGETLCFFFFAGDFTKPPGNYIF